MIRENINILLISGIKIDSTFPTSQFKIPGFSSPFRLDRSENGGGLLFYTREGIPSKLLPSQLFANIECITVEISFLRKKSLIFGTYHASKSLILNHLKILGKTTEEAMEEFCNL